MTLAPEFNWWERHGEKVFGVWLGGLLAFTLGSALWDRSQFRKRTPFLPQPLGPTAKPVHGTWASMTRTRKLEIEIEDGESSMESVKYFLVATAFVANDVDCTLCGLKYGRYLVHHGATKATSKQQSWDEAKAEAMFKVALDSPPPPEVCPRCTSPHKRPIHQSACTTCGLLYVEAQPVGTRVSICLVCNGKLLSARDVSLPRAEVVVA